MENKLLKVLEGVGLSEHEAAVYLASLSLGPAAVLKIAQASGVKRTTVYEIIQALEVKGLMKVEIKGFKKLYSAEHPERLEHILESRKETVRRNMPEFSALWNLKGGESTLKYYQGLESVKSLYEGMLKDLRPGDDYLVVSDMQRWYDLDARYFQHFIERRAKLDITIRMLLSDSPKARETKQFSENYNAAIKILPPGTDLQTNLVIIPNRVVIHQLIPPILGIAIENASVIKMHREMFGVMWSALLG